MGFLNWLYTVSPGLVSAGLVFCVSFLFARSILGSERKEDTARKLGAEAAERWDKRLKYYYMSSVRLLLSWLDRLAGDQYLDRPACKRGKLSSYLTPWSSGLYDLTLRLALAYPIFFLFLVWVLYGHVISGFEIVLSPDIDFRLRWLVFV